MVYSVIDKSRCLLRPTLQADSLPAEQLGKPMCKYLMENSKELCEILMDK